MTLKVGITGQAGFMGTHLYNFLGLEKDIERIPFEDAFFESDRDLRDFVRRCEVIVHLAAMNRHPDMQVIYDTNMRLVRQLTAAMEAEGVTPHVIMSSSTQEERDNLYGRSKREGRKLFDGWAARAGAKFTGAVIPNVFGPFGRPDYNSVVATFCYRLTHNETPRIDVDGSVKLIYINSLCREFIRIIRGDVRDNPCYVPCDAEKKVSELLSLLNYFKESYFDRRIIPAFKDGFEFDLFNTFVCYIDHGSFYPGALTPHTDERGSFVEVLKLDNTGGQVSFSTTRPGVTRGNHYHTRKFERFAVIKGKARLQLRRIGTGEILNFDIDAEQGPGFVDMPVWFTHNISNTCNEDVYTVFWINEFYNPNDPDTFLEEVQK
ncbi:MAG: NAD-dependent epimerase/dehydratase family protein [Victivallaceae bacterium]|nr:NAD-dependent epimerase/dehydratase family protein [Victivallaceae bacterium]